MNRADFLHAHLQYAPEVDDRLRDAAARCVADCRIDIPAHVDRYYPFGVVEAFADMWEVAPGVYLPRAGAVLWSHTEYLTVVALLEEMDR